MLEILIGEDLYLLTVMFVVIQLVILNAIACVDFVFVFAHKNAKCLAAIKKTKPVKSSVLIGFALLIMFSSLITSTIKLIGF
ncbi:hypothetical protein NTHiID11_06020 [Haemophilus influenzae]|nr:hypothetical protein NTHiID11_06020 [Haemophilus influenzae]